MFMKFLQPCSISPSDSNSLKYSFSTSLRTGLRCHETIYTKFSMKLDGMKQILAPMTGQTWWTPNSQDKPDEPFLWTLDLLSGAFSVAALQTLCIDTLTLCPEEHDKWLDMWPSFHGKDTAVFLPICVIILNNNSCA